MSENASEPLYEKLLGETARVSWPELERLFAAGRVIRVDAGLDLIAAAQVFADDDSEQLKSWMQQDQAGVLDDDTAKRWADHDASYDLWAVVVRPWVLVQERASA